MVAGWKDEQWIALYGQSAFDDAMEATEPLLQQALREGLTLRQHTENHLWTPPTKGKGRGKYGGKGKGKGKGQ